MTGRLDGGHGPPTPAQTGRQVTFTRYAHPRWSLPHTYRGRTEQRLGLELVAHPTTHVGFLPCHSLRHLTIPTGATPQSAQPRREAGPESRDTPDNMDIEGFSAFPVCIQKAKSTPHDQQVPLLHLSRTPQCQQARFAQPSASTSPAVSTTGAGTLSLAMFSCNSRRA